MSEGKMNFREKTNLEGKQFFVGKQTCACLQARACTRVTERSEPQELGMRIQSYGISYAVVKNSDFDNQGS
jgi:hypothetical protein